MKKSFLYRILTTYTILICGLIILIFSGFVASIQSSNAKKIQELNNDMLLSQARAYDRAIDGLLYFSNNIKSLNTLDLFALSSQDKYYWRMTDLYSDLVQANTLLSDADYQIMIHKQSDATVITNTGSTRIQRILEEFGLTPTQYQEILSELGHSRMNQERLIITDGQLIYITQKDFVDTKMIVILCSSFEKQGLSYGTDQGGLSVNFSVHDPRIVDNRTEKPELSLGEDEWAELTDSEVHTFKPENSSERYQCVKSAYYDIVFYCLGNRIYPAEMTSQILKIVLLSVLACIMACGAVAVLAHRLYRPISKVVNTLLTMEESDGLMSRESQNELDYLTQKVAQIRHQNQSLILALDNTTKAIRKKIVSDILQGTEEIQTIQSSLKQYGLEWVAENAVPVLLSFTDLKWETYDTQEGVVDRILNMLDEQLKKYYVLERGGFSYGETICYVLKDAQPAALKQQLYEILSLSDAAFQISFHAFIGDVCHSIRELQTSFAMTKRLAENYRRLPIKNIYDSQDLELLQEVNTVYPLNLEMKLVQNVEQQNQKEVERLLRQLLTDYIRPAFHDKQSRESIIFAAINTLNRAAQQVGVDFSQLNEEGDFLFIELKLCQSPEELHQILQRKFEEIMSGASGAKQIKENNLKEELLTYLQQNISRDISLSDLAEAFQLSPNYMSALFKSLTGSNFKEYFSQMRYERAIEILQENPDIKLTQLGEQIGVTNMNTLTRIFKKYGGISPGQYQRDLHQKQSE